MPSKILVVDDEPLVLDSFERALQIEGHAVWKATTAQDALALCEQNSFDLVILDFIMPSMDGVELLARIRKIQPLIRSAIISGKIEADVDEGKLSKDLGAWVEADQYLHKPVSAPKLRQAVADLLGAGLPDDWKALAEKAVKAQDFKISTAKAAAKKLRTLKKKR